MKLSYILPIRRAGLVPSDIQEIASYLRSLAQTGCEILVIDGSPASIFALHHAAWSSHARHIAADGKYGYLNGKVNGIHTGLSFSSFDATVVADDDIRYDAHGLSEIYRRLESAELVRPQNYFPAGPRGYSLTWWARLESARMLLNRGFLSTGDYSGTCGFRKSAFRRVGAFDGDVLFDNEEMVRHFVVAGASIDFATDLFIEKRPPTITKWWEQRPRQAYEDFVMRLKTAFFLAIIPALVASLCAGGPITALVIVALIFLPVMAIAQRGRRGTAGAFFPWWLTLYAPLWILERSVSVYWALYWRITRRGYPFGDRILSKGTGRDWVAGARLLSSGH